MKAKMILSLLIVCLASAALLSYVYTVTTPIIEKGISEELDKQLREVFPSAHSISYYISESDTVLKDTLWVALDSLDNQIGILFKVFPKGYGGPIETLVGLASDTTVVAIRPVTPSEGLKETPGLGVKLTEQTFKDQFRAKKKEEIYLEADGGKIDAITAATISSRAVTNGVREGIENYAVYLNPFVKGEGSSQTEEK